MPLRPALAAIIAACLAGCAQFPELDAAISPGAKNADYPDLVPIEQLKAQVPEVKTDSDTLDEIDARVESLRTRAQRLRGTVIDSPTRARMQTGVNPS